MVLRKNLKSLEHQWEKNFASFLGKRPSVEQVFYRNIVLGAPEKCERTFQCLELIVLFDIQTRPRNYKQVMLLCSQTKAFLVGYSATHRKYRVQDRMLTNDICALVIVSVKDTETHGPQIVRLPLINNKCLKSQNVLDHSSFFSFDHLQPSSRFVI